MKAEQYLLRHIADHDISLQKIEQDVGINLELQMNGGRELKADEFVSLCAYLGITPEEVSDQIF